MNIATLKAALQGKKSYIVIGIGIVVAVLQHYTNIDIPPQLYGLLAALLGITIKAGQNRVEKAASALLDAIDQEKATEDATNVKP